VGMASHRPATPGSSAAPRQLIILGAGTATRLGALSRGLPKPLLEVGGELLLRRQLALVDYIFPEIEHRTVVVGHRSEAMAAALADQDVRLVHNEHFATTNTAASFRLALEEDASDCLLLNGDVWFDAAALNCLRGVGNAALTEFKDSTDLEEIQVSVDAAARVERIGKGFSGHGEAVGMYRFDQATLGSYIDAYTEAARRTYYEDVLSGILGHCRLRAVPMSAGFAQEIDTPQDLDAVLDHIGWDAPVPALAG
jgi:choline kinase